MPATTVRSTTAHTWLAGMTALLVWVLALAWFTRAHPEMAPVAAGGAGYAAVLAGLTVWLVRPPQDGSRLRAAGKPTPLWVWFVAATGVLVWSFLYGFAFGGLYGGVQIPYLTSWIAMLARWRAAPGIDGTTLLNFVSFALLPGAVLLIAGVKPRELGLCAPVPGTRLASAACLALPAVFIAWGFVQGKLTVWLLAVMVVHNLLSNGISEEFQCRGLLLAPLRAVVPTPWAVVVQGLLFGLFHLGGAYAEEGGDVLTAAAGAVSLNAPMGVALGVIAVRTGSLALPTAIHVAGHVMIELLR